VNQQRSSSPALEHFQDDSFLLLMCFGRKLLHFF
jgi:hypothetical protein